MKEMKTERIAALRKARGLTQSELGDLVGVTARSIQNYESGRIPRATCILRIANALEVDPEYFYSDDELEPGPSFEERVRELVRDEIKKILMEVIGS